jgi:hypothetical protein
MVLKGERNDEQARQVPFWPDLVTCLLPDLAERTVSPYIVKPSDAPGPGFLGLKWRCLAPRNERRVRDLIWL